MSREPFDPIVSIATDLGRLADAAEKLVELQTPPAVAPLTAALRYLRDDVDIGMSLESIRADAAADGYNDAEADWIVAGAEAVKGGATLGGYICVNPPPEDDDD